MIYLNNQTLKMGEENGSSFAGAVCGGNVVGVGVGVMVFPVQVGGVIEATGVAVGATVCVGLYIHVGCATGVAVVGVGATLGCTGVGVPP